MGRDFPFLHATCQLQVKDSRHVSIMRDAYAKVKRKSVVCVCVCVGGGGGGGGSTSEMNIKVFFYAFNFFSRHCWRSRRYDSKDRTKSVEIVLLLACHRDISGHKSAFSIIGIEDEVELLLVRATIFAPPRNKENWTICPQHRASLGARWKRSSSKCSMPVSLSRQNTTTS